MLAPTNVEDIKRVIQSINAPVSINLLYGGKSPAVSIEEIASWGAARVSIPIAALMSVAHTLEYTYNFIKKHKEINSLQDRSYSFNQFANLVGLQKIRELEQLYLEERELKARYKY